MTPIRPGLIEIFLLTYNRAPFLERTLKYLLESPFKSVPVTILDNCSTDRTPDVCGKLSGEFENLKVIRHAKNIGAPENLLRALAIAKAEYTWVLCDDDVLDLGSCGDILEELSAGTADLIIVGVPGRLPFAWGVSAKYKSLFASNRRLFHALSFLPSAIFKTELLTSKVLQQASLLSGDLFPHLAIYGPMFHSDVNVYVAKKQVIHQDCADPYWWTQLEIMACWVRSCNRVVSNDSDKRTVIYERVSSNKDKHWPFLFFKCIVRVVVIAKAQQVIIAKSDRAFRKSVLENYLDIFSGCTWDQRVILVFCSPLLLVPDRICLDFKRVHAWFKYATRGQSVPPVTPPESLFSREAVKNIQKLK